MITDLNGWNLQAMSEAVNSIKERPDAGKLTWRSRVAWDGGFGLDVRTLEIRQFGDSIDRRFTMRGDHPPELLGRNTGPTAIETLLAAIGACMSGTFAAQATARCVKIDALEVDVEGAIDLNGFFGLTPIAPGLTDVTLKFRVASDADPVVLRDILEATRARSPVLDSMMRPLTIATALVKSS